MNTRVPGSLPRRRGISLVETLLGFALLAVAVLALMGALPAAAWQQQGSSMSTQALYFAEDKMDELLQLNQKISTTSESDYPWNDGQGARQWWGTAVVGNPDVQMITVDVAWLEQRRLRRVTLRSWVAP